MSPETGWHNQSSSRVARSDAVIFTEFDDATVMMDVEVACYYELNATGARIWTLVESAPRVAEVGEALAAEYEVAAETCDEEVRAFMDELLRRELIQILPGDDADVARERRHTRHPATRSRPREVETPARIAAPRHGREPRAKLAWTTPAIRVMSVARVAGTPQMGSPYTEAQGFPYSAPTS